MFVRGFSYIELIFTIAIIALLATAVVPYVELTVIRKKEAELSRSLRQIRTAIDDYKKTVEEGIIAVPVDASGYPPDLTVLVDGVPNAKDPQKKPIYFLRRLPRDPMNINSKLPADMTWGKRSYDSPSAAPREGRDVFDVYSLSEEKGLNGVPYREW
jgi:general secretion pathway protein G